MSPAITALVAFALWQLLLTVALGVFRTTLVNSGRKAPNAFAPDGSDVGGLGQRLTRARDNCYENLPMFAALVIAAGLTNRLAVLDPLAYILLLARIGQSVTHIASTSPPAIFVRFGFYIVQISIMIYWAIRLLS
jgi:uncharacterized MAPEG superfamily protein